MKTIVLATDFTDSTAQVADYALALARQLHARLVIVHAYERFANGPTDVVSTTADPLEQIREQLIHTSQGSVDVSVVARYGEPRACIEAVVAEQQADLLVMALADNRPYTARFMGSLSTTMIPQTLVSMLILPPGSSCKPIETVVLALDLSAPINAVVLGHAKEFLLQLGATAHILCMDDDPDPQQREAAQSIQGLFDGLPNTFSFRPGYDLTSTLDEYLMTHPADLIMLLPNYHSRLNIWLMESVTQQVARQSVVPVLAFI